MDVAIDRVHPVIGVRHLPIHGLVVGDTSAELDTGMWELFQVPNNALGTGEVVDKWLLEALKSPFQCAL